MVLYKMAKAKKTETTKAPEMATIAVEVVGGSKKTTKAAKTAAPKTTKAAKTTTTTTTETTDVAVKNEVVATEDTNDGWTDTFSQFLNKLQTIASQMNSLKSEFRALEKRASRELRAAQKINNKRKRKTGNRSPSGFVKPTLISEELAKFLQKPIGTEMARTEVTREINGYIRAHDLQDKTNGRKINPDAGLQALLKIGSGEELTYFNLQRYMSPHFAKATPKVAVVAPTA